MSFGRTPQRCIRSPAMMKNGMARSGKESIPPNIRVGSTAMGTVPDSTMKLRPPSPRQNAMGTPSVIVSANTTIRSAISTRSELPHGHSWLGAGASIVDGALEAEQPRHDHERHQQRAHGKGEVEPEDRHAERQRLLVALRGEHLKPGHHEHEQEEQ